MSFQPFTLGSGLAGWSLLKTTLPVQRAAYTSNYATQSDTTYFKETFGQLNTAEDIVSDRRILRVLLGAYGLSDDIDNRHFIKTVMAEGVSDRSALANKLSDQRYRALAQDFDFSGLVPGPSSRPDLAEKTISNYFAQSFEVEIGKSDTDMRLALGFNRSLQEAIASSNSNSTAWFQILATPPLREVVQTAIGLPSEFAQLDIDDQHARIQEKAARVFGTNDLSELATPSKVEEITRRFLVMREANAMSVNSSRQIALVILGSTLSKTQL